MCGEAAGSFDRLEDRKLTRLLCRALLSQAYCEVAIGGLAKDATRRESSQKKEVKSTSGAGRIGHPTPRPASEPPPDLPKFF